VQHPFQGTFVQATRLIVLRHGETTWNRDTRIQGHTDIDLNATGRWQANCLGTALADSALAAVYSSDLRRAFDTAQAVAHAQGLTATPHTGLRERCFGSLEGMTWAEIEAQQPQQAVAWRTRVPDWAPAGGESLVALRQRVLAVLNELAQRHLGQHIALVAHGGVLDVIYRAATGLELQAPRSWLLKNAAINRLLWTPESLTLVGWGDTAHLETGGAPLDEKAA
jgi:2,3-bisphosphoglycerate-dependent phosphoglycerate mutase